MHQDDEIKIEEEMDNGEIFPEEINEEEIEENIEVKIKGLKEKLKKCEAEKHEFLTGWQRAKADYINARKEEEQKREDYINYKTENILKEFLSVADAFEQAFKNDEFKNLEEGFRKGIEAIHSQLAKILEKHKIKPYESLSEIFDPQKHEALMAEEVSESEKDHIILEEFQKGYSINDRVLRPAKVRVGIYKENKQ